MIDSLSYETYMGKQLPSEEVLNFYHTNLCNNAEKGDLRSMRTLGY